MKTFFISLCLTLGTALPVQGFENDPLRIFAACAGRLSAVMEHQWMFDGPASENTKLQRANVLDLIEAVMTPDQEQTVMQWRLDAKHAQSGLLTRATFNDDPADSAWARAQALHHHQSCAALLLG